MKCLLPGNLKKLFEILGALLVKGYRGGLNLFCLAYMGAQSQDSL